MLRLLAAAALLTLSLTASVGAVDLTSPVTQLDGKPLLDASGRPDPQTLGGIIVTTLMFTDPGMQPSDKSKRFWIAFRVHEAMQATRPMPVEYSFTPDELTEIKSVLEKYQSVLVAGQCLRLLYPDAARPR